MKNSITLVAAVCLTVVSCVTISSLKEIYISSLSAKQKSATCTICKNFPAVKTSTH